MLGPRSYEAGGQPMPTTRRSRAKRTRPTAGAQCAVLTFSARTNAGIGTNEPTVRLHEIRNEANPSTPTRRKCTNEFPEGHERTRPRPRRATNPARVAAAQMHQQTDAGARANPATQPGGSRNEPCLVDLWQGGGAPPLCRGVERGVGDRNEPRDLSPSLSVIPAPHPCEPERLSGASPQTRMGPGWSRAGSSRWSAWT